MKSSNSQAMQNLDRLNRKDEIDLIVLLKIAWTNRKLIIWSVIIVTILALLLSFLKSPKYTATSTMVPQTAKSSAFSGGLSSLASLAGIDLSSSSSGASTLSPLVYPQIVESTPFLQELMSSKYKFPKIKQKISLLEYYTDYKKESLSSKIRKYTIGLPFLLLGTIKGSPKDTLIDVSDSTIIHLNKKQNRVLNQLKHQLSVEINKKEGYITLQSTFFNPSIAAQVAQKAKDLLQKYINAYKMEKAQDQLKFIHARYLEKKKAFENAQEALARFNDQNRYVSTAIAKTEQERLESEYNLTYDVYSSLAKQLEQAQITAKEDTPILTTIEPVQVPQHKDGMGKISILIIGLFLGTIIGTGLVFAREFLTVLKVKWKLIPDRDTLSSI